MENQQQQQLQEQKDLNQLIQLLDSIQKLSLSSESLLDEFQKGVIESLKKTKQDQLNKLSRSNYYDLKNLTYNIKINASIVDQTFIVFKNPDNNDVFRLIFASFALNIPFDKNLDGNPFNSLNSKEKLDYLDQTLFQIQETKIMIEDKFITSNQAKEVVLNILQELNEESRSKTFLSLCFSLIKKLQNKINDLCVVAFMRAMIYNTIEDNTPPFDQLLDILSEINSILPIQEQKEFWWKACNAFCCFIYLGQENTPPQKLGYPTISDGRLQLPDILLIKQNNELKYVINQQFKPVYMKQVNRYNIKNKYKN